MDVLGVQREVGLAKTKTLENIADFEDCDISSALFVILTP